MWPATKCLIRGQDCSLLLGGVSILGAPGRVWWSDKNQDRQSRVRWPSAGGSRTLLAAAAPGRSSSWCCRWFSSPRSAGEQGQKEWGREMNQGRKRENSQQATHRQMNSCLSVGAELLRGHRSMRFIPSPSSPDICNPSRKWNKVSNFTSLTSCLKQSSRKMTLSSTIRKAGSSCDSSQHNRGAELCLIKTKSLEIHRS